MCSELSTSHMSAEKTKAFRRFHSPVATYAAALGENLMMTVSLLQRMSAAAVTGGCWMAAEKDEQSSVVNLMLNSEDDIS